MSNNSRHSTVLALGFGAALAGCGNVSGTDTPNVGKPMTYQHGSDATTTFSPGATGLQYNAGSSALVDPVVDYMLALRTASLKLRGNLPSLLEQENLKNAIDSGNADDAQNTYESLVKGYINNSPALFNKQMFHFWRNTMRMGGPTPLNALFSDTATTMKSVDLDTAPAFAAMLVANDRPMTELFTAQDPTCPTFDQVSGNFTPANCYMGATATTGNNVPSGSQAGVLTNPGFLAQYYSNFGFRRARLIQELFACTRYPAELSNAPQQLGPYLYSSPWPVNSVSSNSDNHRPIFNDTVRPRRVRQGFPAQLGNTEYVDFKVDCQNCHSSLNHRAPMFGIFDQTGFRDPKNLLMVTSTATGSPFASIQEYLYECNPQASDTSNNPVCAQALAWRSGGARFDFGGTSVPNFLGFGQEMAGDPQVAKCFMIRAWNYAYSRDDVVNELALVPDNVISELTTYFVQSNYNMKAALLKLYTSANFIRF